MYQQGVARATLLGMLREFYAAQEGKAFGYDIRLTDAGGALLSGGGPMAYNDYNGVISNPAVQNRSPLQQREARVHMQTYGGDHAIDWLFSAIDFTSTSAASAEWQFKNNDGVELVTQKKPSDPSDVQLAPADAIKLFQKPNPYMRWSDLLELLIIDYMLVGNAYWVKWQTTSAGKPLALYRMSPAYVKIQPGQFGPEKYLYRLPGAQNDTEFTPDQVVHFKRPNPNDPFYGLGVVQAGARGLDLEIELTKTAANYYRRGTLPSGVVQTDRRVPKDVFNKLKQQIRSFYSGSDNAGQLMVLEAGLKYSSLSPSAAEALFQQMGSWSMNRVLALFKLNRSLLGIWDTGDNPNLALWQTLFDQKTMIPLCSKLSDVISDAVTQPGWGIDFDINYTETQQPDAVLNRAGTLAKIPGVKLHEVRAAAGLTPSTGDKSLDETVLNMPGPNLDANGQGGSPDPNLPGEPGRPPLPENTTQFKRRTGTNRAPAAVAGGNSGRVASSGKALLDDILADLDAHKKALSPANVQVGNKLTNEVPPQDALYTKRTTANDAIIHDTSRQLAQAAQQLERSLLDALDGKAEGTAYQRIKNSRAWVAFTDKLESILGDAAQAGMSNANIHHAASGMNTADLDYAAEAEKIIGRQGGVASLVKTLRDRVQKAILTGQQKADPLRDLQKALQEKVGDWITNATNQIATDTVTVAYNHGTLAVAEANNATHVLVSDGTDFDEPCIAANGQTWTIAEARDNPQEHSRCRRAFVPVVA